ncbi:MAG: hypothetical protein HYX22_01055 [Candidatus Yanofskybacteria bacterium]|nr:hypothetical protein [Candidatus Yanofskybacteria bacterium]
MDKRLRPDFIHRKAVTIKSRILDSLITNRDKSFIHRYDWFLLGFLAVAAISVKNSSDFYVGAFLWLKLVEFALFYFYLKMYAIRRFGFIGAFYALIIGGAFQAAIAIGQFLKQGDLGLRWLGESVFGPHMTGVASFFTLSNVEEFIDSGLKIIRAYGTTPHPNVLAAYLFLSIFAFYFIFIYQIRSGGHKHYDTMVYHSERKFYDTMIYHKILKYWWVGVYPILLFGLFFTFSRTIIFLWGVGFLVIIAMNIWAGSKTLSPVDKRLRPDFIHRKAVIIKSRILDSLKTNRDKSFIHRVVALVLVTFIVVGAFSFLYWPEVQSRMTLSSEEEAVQLRIFYNEESLKGGINLFGIGLGDFTGWLMEQNPNLPSYMYQPVHNIYLLVHKEIGIIGFALFLLFLIFILTNSFSKKVVGCWLLVVGILLIGLFDHFLLTLQQGRFVFWIALALLGALAPSPNKRFSENDLEQTP